MKVTELFTKTPRPMTGLLNPVIRYATPSKVHKNSSSKSSRSMRPFHSSLSKSPYKQRPMSKVKSKASMQITKIKTYIPKSIYSWSCRTNENKFKKIRPCIIIKPNLSDSVQIFGLCDGNNKELVSLISAHFTDLIEQTQNIDLTPRNSLYDAYQQTVSELRKSSNILVPHEICVVLLKGNRILSLISGKCAVVLGRRTFRGWSAEVINGNVDRKLDCGNRIVVICNSGVNKVLSPQEIIDIVAKYWDVQNPNIASWEITEKAKIIECPICLVIFLTPSGGFIS